MRLCKIRKTLYICSILFVAYQSIRPEVHIPSIIETGEEIGERHCGDTYDVAHFAYAKIAEPIDVSKPAECRNYSLRCTLCSGFSVHPFSFSPSFSLRISALRFRGCTHTFSLPPSPRLLISPLATLDLLYLAYPAATIPYLYALIPVHTDNGYLRENIPWAQRLPCIMPAIFVSSFAPRPSHYFERPLFHKTFIIYKIRQGQCKHI